jgi:hypothetical protein
VRIFVGKHPDGFDFFFWNIDANVGLFSPNIQEDVQLVQFGYFAASLNPHTTPDLKRIFAAVTPGAPYSGDQNDPLTLAIIANEKARGGTQDRHVSVIKGTGFYDSRLFMLAALGNHMRDLLRSDFPRLDKHPKCPLLVRAAVVRSFDLPPGK